MYRISAYSPQVIRGKVSFLGGDSISVSTLCNVGSASKTAIGYSALATAYNADDQFVLAVQSADKALQIDPGLEIAIEIKASALGQMGQFSAAIEQYRRAISLGNAGPDILNGYAWFLADRLPNPTRVQLTEAKRMAEEAIKGEPNGYNWDTLGWTDYKLGDYVGALAALETSKSLLLRDDSDTSSSAWQELNYHLGNTLIRFKNKQTEALQAFMEVTEYDKKYPSSSNKDYVKAANDQIPKLKASFPSESPVPGRPTRRLSRP
jgi:tetratricopeptide (TPR) repeat protein